MVHIADKIAHCLRQTGASAESVCIYRRRYCRGSGSYIVDDCKKFVERELRRGKVYDAVIMDPPSYGRGPSGEIWKLEDSIDDLILLASRVLSDDPLFFLVNSYTTGLSPSVVSYIMGTIPAFDGGVLEAQELGLPVTETGMSIPCGSSARWSAEL